MIKKIFTLLIAIIFLVLTAQNVYAITPENQQSLYGDSEYYWPTQCSTSGPSAPVSITPGSGAPNGATFPNLDPTAMTNAINTWISQQNANSTLAGLGSTIVASAKNSNINPFLIVAIAKEESSMGDPSTYDVKYANNAFSREATPSQPNYPGAGVNAGTLWYKWSS